MMGVGVSISESLANIVFRVIRKLKSSPASPSVRHCWKAFDEISDLSSRQHFPSEITIELVLSFQCETVLCPKVRRSGKKHGRGHLQLKDVKKLSYDFL